MSFVLHVVFVLDFGDVKLRRLIGFDNKKKGVWKLKTPRKNSKSCKNMRSWWVKFATHKNPCRSKNR